MFQIGTRQGKFGRISMQSVISNIDLENRKIVLRDVKKKMEQILPTVNPSKLDLGCPKTVGGKHWLNKNVHALGNSKVSQLTNLREEEENECFRFGPSQVYVSKKAAILPSKIGKTTKKIRSQS